MKTRNESILGTPRRTWLPRFAGIPALLGIIALGNAAEVAVTTTADENNGSLDPGLGAGTSLREAVLHAPAGSTIFFTPAVDGQIFTLVSGQLLITKNLNIDAFASPSGITVSGNDNSRVFDIQAGKTVVMTALRIIHGDVTGTGGGIRNAGTLTLNECEVTLNEASTDGGGLYSSGPLTLNGSSVTLNTCGDTGGGIVAEGVLTLDGSTVSNNTSGGNGGGIYADSGTLTLTDCTLSGNVASGWPGGGGIDNDNGGSATLVRCTLSGNSSGSNAGGIGNEGTLTLSACTLSGNSAANEGGAIEHVSGVLTLTSCTLAGNSAKVGGGIDGDGTSTIRLYSCTASGNLASDKGGGIEETSGTLLLENSLIGGNTATNSGPDLKCSSINTQAGVNLLSSINGVGGSFTGIVASPVLSSLGNHGGPTQTMPPMPGSPAINAGGATALALDQRGLPRVVGAAADIGAVEVQESLVVTTTANSGAGSLRDLVALAPAGATITFAPALDHSTILLTSGPIVLDKDLVLDGSARVNLAVSGNESSQVFQIAAGDTVSLIGLEILDGSGIAGGLIHNGGNLSLQGCVVSGGDAPEGAGVYNAAGAFLVLDDCELSGNLAYERGGAVFNAGNLTASDSLIVGNGSDSTGGAIHSSGTLAVIRCTIAGNYSFYGGGGIRVEGSGGSLSACTIQDNLSVTSGGGIFHGAGPLILTNCTLSGNLGDTDFGGGIYSASTLTVTSCTIAGNEARSEGGGIYIAAAGQLTLANSIVADNTAPDAGPDFRGAISSQAGVNLLGSSAGLDGTFSGITGSARLLPLADFGGPTAVVHPMPGSPAINGGGATVLGTDQRGLARIVGGAVDIGAVEMQPSLVVTTTNDAGPGSLRQTVATAANGAVISFAPSLEGETIGIATGETEENPVLFDKNLVVDASDLENLALAPTGQTSLLKVLGNATVGVSHLELRNGWGGAVRNEGSLILEDCLLSGNSAGEGGALYNAVSSEVTFLDCRLSGNSADEGGALYNAGEMTLSNTVLFMNEADQQGGAIRNTGFLTVNDSVLTTNGSQQFGGAIYSTGSLHMARCTVERNSSGDSGGGILASGSATIDSCTISGNECGGSGGGVFHGSAGTMSLTRCTLEGNRSYADFGGGLFSSGTVIVNACTIANNDADIQGGGIFMEAPAQLTLENSIVAGNLAPLAGPDLFGAIHSQLGVNLLGDTDGVSGGFGGIVADPLLEALGLHGGPTLTMPPKPGSPVIDAAGPTVLTTDQRGLPRVVGGAMDIGAVETGNTIPTLVVDTTADENNGIAVGNVSLRDAIAAAAPGSVVTFAPALSAASISLTVGQLALEKDVTIDASSLSGGVTITGTVLRGFEVLPGRHVAMRGLEIAGIIAPFDDGGAILNSGSLELTACTLSGNMGNHGGAIRNAFPGRLFMTDCTFFDNEGQDDGGGLFNDGEAELSRCHFVGNGTFSYGAGIFNEFLLSLTDCTFDANFANFSGGGLFNGSHAELDGCELTGNVSEGGFGGGIMNAGTLDASDTSITGNEAWTDGEGAGIHNTGSMELNACSVSYNLVGYEGNGIFTTGTLAMTGCTVEGNVAEGNGGGVHLAGTSVSLTGCTVSGNTSGLNGGGIYQESGSLSLINSTIAGNEAREDFGGGIYSNGGTLSAVSCTIAGNQAVYEGGGLHVVPAAQLTLNNTIVAGNFASDTGPDLRGAIFSQLGVNLLGSTDGVTVPFTGIVADPLLDGLGIHGGPTLTRPPKSGSPAINAGGATALTTDQRGFTRVVGGTVDIGAVESGNAIPVIVVNTIEDENDGVAAGNISLRDALADSPAGSTVIFASSLDDRTLELALDQLVVNKNLVIDASALEGGLEVSGDVVRAFKIGSGSHVILRGLTIADIFSWEQDGAAILNDGTLELSGCTLYRNHGLAGGAIHNTGRLVMTSCGVIDNEGEGRGGFLFNRGQADLTGCVLSGNGSSDAGAAIYSEGSLALTTCTITGSYANAGGGGLFNTGPATIDRCTIYGNSGESAPGGGIFNSGTLTVTSSTLFDNENWTGYEGAGISNSGNLSVTSSTITGNRSNGEGGGIYNSPTGQLSLENSIVAGNTAEEGGPDIFGSIQNQTGVNLLSTTAGVSGPFTGIVGNAMLQPLGIYGGPTATMPPLPGSPAINAGGTTFLTVDQRGFTRVIGGTVDIGSVETGNALPTVVVNTTVDENDGIGIGNISLRDAVSGAVAGSTITFAPALDGKTLTLTVGQLALDKNLVIDASALPQGLTLTGSVPRAFRVASVSQAGLKGLTIADILSYEDHGAAIRNAGTLDLTDCTMVGNTGNMGGAVHNASSGRLTMSDCVLVRNEGQEDGGGLYNGGDAALTRCYLRRNGTSHSGAGIANDGTLSLTGCSVISSSANGDAGGLLNRRQAVLDRCTFSENRAEAGSGGGIVNTGWLDLVSSTLANNLTQDLPGAGIWNSGFLSVTSCTLSGNTCPGDGGGIYNAAAGHLHLTNSIVAGNTTEVGDGPDIHGAIQSQAGVNLLGSTGGVTTVFTGIVGDPLLQSLGINGGPTLTMLPQPGSPAINAGGATALTTDQRGFSRVVGGTPDIGAIETGNAIPTVVVNTTVDENNGIGTGNISLRDAITGAAAGSTITFAPALNGSSLSLTVGQLEIDNILVIDATALSNGVTVTGGGFRGFEIGLGGQAVVKGLQISDLGAPGLPGGAIRNQGTLELSGCTLSGNLGGDGGAIHNAELASLSVAGAVFSDNITIDGDGGVLFNAGTAEMTDCNLPENGSEFSGGAIYNDGFLTLTTCSLSSNFANFEGGGIYNAHNLSLDRCTLSGNVGEGGSGGGIYNTGILSVRASTIAGNITWTEAFGVGVYNAGYFALTDSIIGDNEGSDGIVEDVHGPVQVQIGVNLLSTTNGVSGGFSGIVADPLLAPFGDYGGPTPVMPPLPGSPAIEGAVLEGAAATDQLGNPRPSGPLPDIGAVEAAAFATLGLADVDADGIPDILEPVLGLTVGVDDSAADSDGDGSRDAEEIGNMTDPADSSSYLRILAFDKAAGFDPETHRIFSLSFPTFPGLSYAVEADQTLDFAGADHVILVPSFVASGFSADFEVVLRPGRDFVRARRE